MDDTSPKVLDALAVESDLGYLPRAIRGRLDIPRHRREKWNKEAQHLLHATPNGYNDPLSHLLLLDTLMRLKPDQTIRANTMRDLLNRMRPQLSWDSVTVGRILNELADMSEGRIKRRRDRFGTFFLLDPTIETYQWLTTLRDAASTLVAEQQRWHDRGLDGTTRGLSVWEGFKLTALGTGFASIALQSMFDGGVPALLAEFMRFVS